MADILQWDLDFARDLRRGDRFDVLYEEVLSRRRPSDVGRIVGLVYDSGGRRHRGLSFGGQDGYYDAEGRPLKKMFLRSPLRYSRITSSFSQRRFHPVLNTSGRTTVSTTERRSARRSR